MSTNPSIVADHFRLLRKFGQEPKTKELGEADLETMWKLSCDAAKLPFVPREEVYEAWKDFALGRSKESSVICAPDATPEYVVVGLAYKGKVFAGHTAKVEPLLVKILSYWSNAFGSEEEYMKRLHRLAVHAVRGKKTK